MYVLFENSVGPASVDHQAGCADARLQHSSCESRIPRRNYGKRRIPINPNTLFRVIFIKTIVGHLTIFEKNGPFTRAFLIYFFHQGLTAIQFN